MSPVTFSSPIPQNPTESGSPGSLRRLCRTASVRRCTQGRRRGAHPVRWGLVLGGAVGLFLSGCSTVQPWERAALADYTMRPDRDALYTTMSEHIFFSREASAGGRGVGGGGCGCN